MLIHRNDEEEIYRVLRSYPDEIYRYFEEIIDGDDGQMYEITSERSLHPRKRLPVDDETGKVFVIDGNFPEVQKFRQDIENSKHDRWSVSANGFIFYQVKHV